MINKLAINILATILTGFILVTCPLWRYTYYPTMGETIVLALACVIFFCMYIYIMYAVWSKL